VSEQAAAIDDRVTIHFEGNAEGENFTNGKVENFPVVLGSKQLIAGFEEQLVGTVPGAQLSFTLPFPEDYSVEKLAGKTAEFSVEVVKVEQSHLPELDTEFLTNFGVEDGNVESFRAEIKTSMEREMRRALASRTKDSVLDALYQRNDSLSLPNTLVQEELKSLLGSLQDEAKKRKQPFDANVAKEHFEPVARRRVALGLLLNKIIEVNQVKVDANRVRSTIEDLALSYENPQEVVNWYYSNREQLSQVQNMVIEDQVVDLILDQAKITEQPISFSDLMQQSNAA
jgi:trigger factor